MQITGRLEDWSKQAVSKDEDIYWGVIYGDTKGRFPDGTFIHTSGVLSSGVNGDIITTRNSIYQLGTPA